MEFKVIKRNGNAVIPDGMFKLCGMEDAKLMSIARNDVLHGFLIVLLAIQDAEALKVRNA